MTMSKDTLATALQRLVPTNSYKESAQNFTDAWEEYFAESSVGVYPVTDGSLSSPLAKMKAAFLLNISSPPLAIQSGIDAFWDEIAVVFAAVWITVPPLASITKPPTLASIQAAVAFLATSSIALNLSLAGTAVIMADAIHTNNLGGTATDTTAPTPITKPIL